MAKEKKVKKSDRKKKGEEAAAVDPIIPDATANLLIGKNIEYRKACAAEIKAKEAHSEASRKTKVCAEEISKLLDEIEAGPGPLFDKGKKDPKAQGEAWREKKLPELKLTPKILKHLAEHDKGIRTVGDLADFSTPKNGYVSFLTDIAGIGKAAAQKIEDVTMEFHAQIAQQIEDAKVLDDVQK